MPKKCKEVVFRLKKCKNFKPGIQKIFSFFFHPLNAADNALVHYKKLFKGKSMTKH